MKTSKKYSAFSLIEISIVILIIGILIAGVTQGNNLINKFRLNTARSLTQSSPVASIPDLATWWESTSEASFASDETDNNDKLTSWNDINPQRMEKVNLTQDTSTYQPLYKKSGINNLPSVYFDGSTGQYFLGTYDESLNYSKTTIFIVTLNQNGSTVGNLYLQGNVSSGGLPSRMIGISSSNYTVATGTNTFTASHDQRVNVFATTDDGTNSYIYINSVNVANTTSGSMVDNPTLVIGSFIANGNFNDPLFSYKGLVGEIIVFSRNLSDSERESVEKYLSQKWNIPLSS